MPYLLLCKSLTYAQRSARVLEQNGIVAGVIKAPEGAQTAGCSYCVRIAEKNRLSAETILSKAGLKPKRIFRMENNIPVEVLE